MDNLRHTPNEPTQDIVPLSRASEAVVPRVEYVDAIEVTSEESETHELLEYWQILRRRKGLFVFIAFLGGLTGLLLTFPQTPVYQARTSVEITFPNESFLNFKDGTAADSFMDYQDSYMQTQVRILQSDSLRSRIIAKLKGAKRPDLSYRTGRLSAWRKALGLPEKAERSQDDSEAALPGVSVGVRIFPNTRIIDITCDSIDPAFAAEYANALTSEYMEQNIEFRSSGSERTRGWLSSQLQDLRAKLEESEQQLQRYGREAGLMYTGDKENVNDEKLRQLQGQLGAANAERIAKQSQFEMVSAGPEVALPDTVAEGPLGDAQAKLAELRREYTELSTIYTPNHYKVKRLETQIAEAEAIVKKEQKNALTKLRSEYEAALHKEKLLTSAYANQAQAVSSQAAKAIEYDILKREVDSNRALHESFLEKVKEAGIVAAMRGNNIRVVDPAKPPSAPYKPNLVLNTALGLLSGAFLGLVFVFVREHADLSLKAPGDSAFYLKVPELGVIPHSSIPSTRAAYGNARVPPGLSAITPGATETPGENGNGQPSSKAGEQPQIELITWEHKPSLVAESFRATLTSILLSSKNGNHPRTLVFTSAGPHEGKTTTVCNLGIALAEINRRVLIIDADMRKPRLHTIFGLPNTWGLSDLLQERSSIAAAPREALVRQTRIPNLFALTSGPATVSISNLLYSPRTAELLRRFSAEFHFILIDTPPMMQIADARVLGHLSDGVILIVGAGRTTRDAARAAKQRLAEDGIPILGTILNRWDPRSASSYGVYGYYDGYYGYGKKKSG